MYATNSTGSLMLTEEKDVTTSRHSNLVKFEEQFRNPSEESIKITEKLKTAVKKKISKCSVKSTVMSYFPIIDEIMTYNLKEYLPNDVIAGLTAGIMMIPQGMAFAALSTLPPIVGLYISFFASITYVFIGTGRQLSWGCIAILSLMIASILDKFDRSLTGGTACVSNGLLQENLTTTPSVLDITSPSNNRSSSDSDIDAVTRRRMEVASGVTVIAGLITVVASRLGLSRVTALMSDSLITGFAVAVSFHVSTSQLKSLLGVSIPRYSGPGQLVRTWITLLQHIPETNVATLILSLIAILIIYLVKRHINERFKQKMRVPIPIDLFVIIAATFASYYGYFNENYDIVIVGDVPVGLPAPKLPDFNLVRDYIGDALIIVIVSFAQSLAMAKTFALKHNYDINPKQEMLANGLCHVMCGLFSGYITGASVSRSLVQDSAGGKTQVASIFAAGLVLLVIMLIGPYFYYLPNCILSAIIIVSLRSMFLKLLDIPKEWRKSKYDCSIYVFTILATIFLNVDVGLLAGVIFSLFLVLFRSVIGPIEEAGQIDTSAETVQLRSLANYSSARKVHSVKILRVKTPLYFINSEIFSSSVLKCMGTNQTNTKDGVSLGINKDPERKEGASSFNGDVMKRQRNVEDEDTIGEKNEESAYLFQLKVVILDMSEVAFIDVMGVKALELIIQQSFKSEIAMFFTNIPENIFPMLQSTGFWKKHADRLFLTNEDVLIHLAEAVVSEDKQSSKL